MPWLIWGYLPITRGFSSANGKGLCMAKIPHAVHGTGGTKDTASIIVERIGNSDEDGK